MPTSITKLLRWSEKYTKTDMVFLFEGSFWSAVAQVAVAAISLILAVVVSRYVSQDSYGVYKYVLATIAILGTFSLTGLSTAVFQSVARGFDGALQQGFWENIKWSAFIFIGSVGIAIYYFAMHNPMLALGMLVGGCTAPFLASANLASNFLAGKRDFVRQAMFFGMLGSGIPLMSIIGAVFVSQNPLWLVIVFSVTNVASSLYFYKRTLDLYRPDATKKDPDMMRYGKHLSFIGILGGIAGNLDQILLFHYVGAAELAIYNFATAILDQTAGPLKTTSAMLTERYTVHSDETIHKGLWNKVFWFFVLAVAIVAIYIPLAPYIYHYLFPGYVEAIPYSQIYALSLFGIVLNPFGPYFTAKKKIKVQYFNSIINYTLQIAVMAVGVIYWGLWGLIWARVFLRTVGSLTVPLFYYASIKKED